MLLSTCNCVRLFGNMYQEMITFRHKVQRAMAISVPRSGRNWGLAEKIRLVLEETCKARALKSSMTVTNWE